MVTPQSAIIVYAGFWRRFAALCIDSALMLGIFIIISIPIATLQFSHYKARAEGTASGDSALLDILSIFFYVGWIIFQWLYWAVMESSSKQATIGKRALGIIVTDTEGNRISFGRATGRYWAKIISSLILLIGFIMVGFTKKKQALHDIIVGTLVVKK